MSDRLSERDEAALVALAHFEDEHKHGPTLRDMMAATGDKSTSSAFYRIEKLIRLGLVERCPVCPPEASKTVRTTDQGRDLARRAARVA